MSSQIFFSKIVQLSTSTKPILKEGFINYTQNKVGQLPNNAIVKGNYIFLVNIKWWKIYLWKNKTYKNILQSVNIFLNDSNNCKTWWGV
jgi:hypothetical protein